jgi:hypothetical protein
VVGGGAVAGVILALPKPQETPPELSLQINDISQTSVRKSVVTTTTIYGTATAHNFSIINLSLASDSIDFFTDFSFDSSVNKFSVKLKPSDTDGAYDLRLQDTSNNVYSNIITITIQPENYLIYDDGVSDAVCYIDIGGDFLTDRSYDGTFRFKDTEGKPQSLNRDAIKEFYLENLPQITTAPANYLAFMCCAFTNLTNVDIRIPNTITTVGAYFCYSLFQLCINLPALPTNFNLPTSINTINGRNFCVGMFGNCRSLSVLPYNFNIPQGITGFVSDYFCSSMFFNCQCLYSLPSNFNLPTNITSTGDGFCFSMFYDCSTLRSDSPKAPINIPNITEGEYFCDGMFGGNCPIEPDTPHRNEAI